jgi:hypothetical protein
MDTFGIRQEQTCALGFLGETEGVQRHELDERLHVVAQHIYRHYGGRRHQLYRPADLHDVRCNCRVTIIRGNDLLRLTPEQFRHIDRLIQKRQILASLEAQITEVPGNNLMEVL